MYIIFTCVRGPVRSVVRSGPVRGPWSVVRGPWFVVRVRVRVQVRYNSPHLWAWYDLKSLGSYPGRAWRVNVYGV